MCGYSKMSLRGQEAALEVKHLTTEATTHFTAVMPTHDQYGDKKEKGKGFFCGIFLFPDYMFLYIFSILILFDITVLFIHTSIYKDTI